MISTDYDVARNSFVYRAREIKEGRAGINSNPQTDIEQLKQHVLLLSRTVEAMLRTMDRLKD